MLEKLLAKTLVFALLMGFLLSGCSSASKPEVINSSKFGPMVQVYETSLSQTAAFLMAREASMIGPARAIVHKQRACRLCSSSKVILF